MILSGRREEALERVRRTCEQTSRDTGAAAVRVEVLPFDVADLEFAENEAAARAIQFFGRVDALVLNAGVRKSETLKSTGATPRCGP